MISAQEALKRLREGNLRFVSGQGGRDLDFEHSRRKELAQDQAPFAVVLGCSDSRVPLELVFDQGLGDLFVVRVAGNVVSAMQAGSVEFAASKFGTPLVVVMGHSQCGAVTTAIDVLLDGASVDTPNLEALVERIGPAVIRARDTASAGDRKDLVFRAVRENVRLSAVSLLEESALLSDLVESGRLEIVCAKYSLETGVVEFFG